MVNSRQYLVEQLSAKLDHNRIRRFSEAAGAKSGLSYLEGHDVIRELNAVFDFEWSHKIEQLELIECGPFTTAKGKDMYSAMYRCVVAISVRTGEFVATHDGVGFGSSTMGVFNKSDVHEVAMKEAETDAIKRAAMKFGDRFGLALYDKLQTNVTKPRDIATEKAVLLAKVIKTFGFTKEQAVIHITTNLPEGKGFADLDEAEVAEFEIKLLTKESA